MAPHFQKGLFKVLENKNDSERPVLRCFVRNAKGILLPSPSVPQGTRPILTTALLDVGQALSQFNLHYSLHIVYILSWNLTCEKASMLKDKNQSRCEQFLSILLSTPSPSQQCWRVPWLPTGVPLLLPWRRSQKESQVLLLGAPF